MPLISTSFFAGGGKGNPPAPLAFDFTSNRKMLYAFQNSMVDGSNANGFAFFSDFEYDGGNDRFLLSIRGSQRMSVSMHAGNIRVSDFSVNRVGTTNFGVGRYRAMVLYDGTTLKAWMLPDGGSRTEEINTAAPSYTGNDGAGNHSQIGGQGNNAGNSGLSQAPLMGKMYAGAYWKEPMSEADALDLIDGNISIGQVRPAPAWWPDPNAVGNDRVDGVLTVKVLNETRQLTAPTDATNFRLLRDPETGLPAQFDAGAGLRYWGAYELDGDNLHLATSTDLETWTANGELFAGEGNVLRPSDFLYLGNIAGGHDPFLLLTTSTEGGESRIYARTSSDMVNWTFDLQTPMFTNTTLSSGGVEDFVVCRHNGSWIACFEHDGLQDGTVAVGIAESTELLPSSGWSTVNNRAFEAPDLGFNTSSLFVANPVCISKDGIFWLFYEGADFTTTTRTLPLTLMRRSANPKSQNQWEEHGVVFYSLGRRCFPNSIAIENGLISVYMENGIGATSDGGFQVGKVEFDPSFLLVA